MTLTENFNTYSEYDTQNVIVVPFRKKHDRFQNQFPLGFSNMDGDYPVVVGSHSFSCVETAYICASYGLRTQDSARVQQMLCNCPNGYEAKRTYRHNEKYRAFAREDFDTSDWRFHFMLAVVWRKCLVYPNFASRLTDLPKNCIIIEDSPWDGLESVWGCINEDLEAHLKEFEVEMRTKYPTSKESAIEAAVNNERMSYGTTHGIWKGRNVQGKILTECKEALEEKRPPAIDKELLNDAKIYWFGKKIRF